MKDGNRHLVVVTCSGNIAIRYVSINKENQEQKEDKSIEDEVSPKEREKQI